MDVYYHNMLASSLIVLDIHFLELLGLSAQIKLLYMNDIILVFPFQYLWLLFHIFTDCAD